MIGIKLYFCRNHKCFPFCSSILKHSLSLFSPNLTIGSQGNIHPRAPSSSGNLSASKHNYRGNNQNILHVLSISASVTRVRWRPLVNDPLGPDDMDRHESMLAVATAPIKGASSGGTGLLMLWSWNRPFMPLSVVEGHKEGAVTGFHWLDTPASDLSKRQQARKGNEMVTSTFRTSSRVPGSKTHEVDAILFENSEHDGDSDMLGVWQHVLSVGRDGRCLVQSFARGT